MKLLTKLINEKKNSFDIDKFSLNCRRLLQVFFTPSVIGGVKTTPSNNRLKFRIGPVRENPSKERLKISRTAKLESETSYASEDIAPNIYRSLYAGVGNHFS